MGTEASRPRPLLALAALFTVVDAVATALWLHLGHATEGNPLLNHLVVQWGAHQAMATRALIGLVLLAGLWRLLARSAMAGHGLVVVTGVLGGVCAWHGFGAALFVAQAVT